ncbi:hypothetical protein BT69DRAFT_1343931 [Atractiella rhizophila]|nr:hypothetical protein BT69DRAFT_1343931 [Atractiella rhizophila]
MLPLEATIDHMTPNKQQLIQELRDWNVWRVVEQEYDKGWEVFAIGDWTGNDDAPSLEQSKRRPDADKFEQARQEELASLKRMGIQTGQ